MKPRIGILGGTFDPVHNAHLALAEKAVSCLDLERVVFMVGGATHHKKGKEETSAFHRYAMVALATAGRSTLVPSTQELEHHASSYTLDALRRFCRHTGVDPKGIVFIAGSDSLRDFHLWHEYRRLIAAFRFVFVARLGVAIGPAAEAMIEDGRVSDGRRWDAGAAQTWVNKHPGSLLVDWGIPDISSSCIRERLHRGQTCRQWLPATVNQYIKDLELYGGK